MARIELSIGETLAKLKNLKKGFSDLSELFKNIADLEYSSTLSRFNNQIDPSGKKWRSPIALRRDIGGSQYSQSHAWHYWKKSNFHAIPKGWHFFNESSDKALRNTGNLFSSIQRTYGSNFSEIGTNLKYGEYVQNKGFEFLGVSEDTRDNIKEAFEAFVKDRL